MGKGDKRSKKGKITIGSYGVSRPRKANTTSVAPAKAEPKVKKEKAEPKAAKPAAKKAPKKKTEE
jgi:30S ribosomal protein S31